MKPDEALTANCLSFRNSLLRERVPRSEKTLSSGGEWLTLLGHAA